LTTRLLTVYKQKIEELRLIPSDGGCFELKANGALLFSKLETGKFPDEQAMVAEVGKKLK
jgi:selenoprotein W-related protein